MCQLLRIQLCNAALRAYTYGSRRASATSDPRGFLRAAGKLGAKDRRIYSH
jgi:hypothetical protein